MSVVVLRQFSMRLSLFSALGRAQLPQRCTTFTASSYISISDVLNWGRTKKYITDYKNVLLLHILTREVCKRIYTNNIITNKCEMHCACIILCLKGQHSFVKDDFVMGFK